MRLWLILISFDVIGPFKVNYPSLSFNLIQQATNSTNVSTVRYGIHNNDTMFGYLFRFNKGSGIGHNITNYN